MGLSSFVCTYSSTVIRFGRLSLVLMGFPSSVVRIRMNKSKGLTLRLEKASTVPRNHQFLFSFNGFRFKLTCSRPLFTARLDQVTPTYFKYLFYRRRGNFCQISAFPANGAFLELKEPVQLTLARLQCKLIWKTAKNGLIFTTNEKPGGRKHYFPSSGASSGIVVGVSIFEQNLTIKSVLRGVLRVG